jgi:hypothetical protein
MMSDLLMSDWLCSERTNKANLTSQKEIIKKKISGSIGK